MAWMLSGGLALVLCACGGGGSGGGGSASARLDVEEVSHGFGVLLPHQIRVPDANGFPTQQVVSIRTDDDLRNNATLTNPVLAPAAWPASAVLPNGDAGNHFVYARFTMPLDVDSVLDSSPSGQANSGLLQTIAVVAMDPATGQSTPVRGRAFIDGRTYAGVATGSPPRLPLQAWIGLDGAGKPIALDVNGSFPGLGFPGTQSAVGFQGSSNLVRPDTFVFVPDADGNLATPETFPAGRQIRLAINQSVLSTSGEPLIRQAVASTTVGVDVVSPEVIATPVVDIVPGAGDTDVDPMTPIRVRFTEPVQPLSVGPPPSNMPPQISSAVTVQFGPQTQTVTVPFTAVPVSVLDLSYYELQPAFAFPGSGPDLFQCGTYNRVDVNVNAGQVQDLPLNLNTAARNVFFFTGEGPGIVNAPVAPDVIYVARSGATPGLSVIDLNGFGASTGDPTFDFTFQSFPEGNSNYPNNPNVRLQGAMLRPPLQPGSCTIDGGSAGVFTLTKDSALDDKLIKAPLLTSVGEMMLGQTLESVFHNGQEPTGCQSGGGNLCAISGLKVVSAVQTSQGGLSPSTNNTSNTVVALVPGGANPITWAPHPNPPPLVFPPLCLSPFIGGQEVTSVESILPIPPLGTGAGLTNLLVPGDALGNPNVGIPPSGLLVPLQNAFFEGPGRPGQPIASCTSYQIRQQVGHFLYMIDRNRREVVVLNSNRFTVLDRIPTPDPTSLAMGPNLNFLAVTNQTADTVSFININPASASFHDVVKTTNVGRSPRGIAWEPGNEDILVCNEGDDTVSIISAFSLNVRKTVSGQLNQPFEVAITPRQQLYGFFRNVYFGWILNRDGRVALFESGPNGVNGWGFDDVIGVAPFTFQDPKTIHPDLSRLTGGVWVLHENPLNPDGSQSNQPGGAVTNLVLSAAVIGQVPLGSAAASNLRDMSFGITTSIGPNRLTGIPVDVAFDEQTNRGLILNWSTPFSAGEANELNGKSIVRPAGATAQIGVQSQYMFLSIPNSSQGGGAVDVINVNTGFVRVDTNAHQPGIQSIPVSGPTLLGSYFKQ